MKKASSLHFPLLFLIYVMALGAQAYPTISVPVGFKTQIENRSFRSSVNSQLANVPSHDWLRIDGTFMSAFVFADLGQGICDVRPDAYQSTLETYKLRWETLDQDLGMFSEWIKSFHVMLASNNLLTLPTPLRIKLSPVCSDEIAGSQFDYSHFSTNQEDSWVSVQFHVPDQDRYLEQKNLIFHEFGHLIFQKIFISEVGHESAPLSVGPLNEGFADFIAYSFSHEREIFRKFDPITSKTKIVRSALTSSPIDRNLVRSGKWTYFPGDPHLRGEAFRDVLIEMSQSGPDGVKRAVELTRDIVHDIVYDRSFSKTSSAMDFSNLNTLINASIVKNLINE